MVKKIKAPAKPDAIKRFGREDIINRAKAVEQDILIPEWNGYVRMRTIPFEDYVQIQMDSAGDAFDIRARIVAAVCVDLSINDVNEFRGGNGAQFGVLFSAVDDFLGLRIPEERIKN